MRYVSQEELRRQLMLLYRDSKQTIDGFAKSIGISHASLNKFMGDPNIRLNGLTFMKIVKFVQEQTGEQIMLDLSTISKRKS